MLDRILDGLGKVIFILTRLTIVSIILGAVYFAYYLSQLPESVELPTRKYHYLCEGHPDIIPIKYGIVSERGTRVVFEDGSQLQYASSFKCMVFEGSGRK